MMYNQQNATIYSSDHGLVFQNGFTHMFQPFPIHFIKLLHEIRDKDYG